MRRSLKATTAILASLNLALPLPALAQAQQDAQGQAAQPGELDCAENPENPACATVGDPASEGGAPETAPAQEAPEAAAEEPTGAASGTSETTSQPAPAAEDGGAPEQAGETEGGAGAVPEAPATEDPATATQGAGSDTMDAPDMDTSGGGAGDTPPSATTADEGASTGTGGETTDQGAETGVEAPATDGAAGEAAETPSTGDLEDALREDAESMSDGDAGTGPSDATDTQTPDAMDGTDAAGDGQQPAPSAADEAGSGSAPAEGSAAETAGEGEPDAAAEESVSDAPDGEDAPQPAVTDDGTAPATAVEGSATEPTAGEAPSGGGDGATTDSESAAIEGEAPRAAAAAEDAEPVESESTTVTEETARSSSEDFQSRIDRTEDADAERASADRDEDEGGLSTLEKGLLLGAGALAVGAVLNNNRRVVASSDDRVVVSRGEGEYELIKDDNAILARPGSQVETQTFDDGSSRTTVSYDDGSRIVTIRDADLRVLRRERITPNGERILLIDDLGEDVRPVDVQRLQQSAQPSRSVDLSDEQALREALSDDRSFDRAYSLNQVRNIQEVRSQVPAVDLEAITFDTGSAAIRPEQAEQLRALGAYIRDTIAQNPRAVFMVEGHTDAVGDAAYNLALSDRRAESVALALGEYFDVPTSNLVVQGYGERFLKVESQGDERVNRRATVRNITPLLQAAAAN